jgi:hypothetical protein
MLLANEWSAGRRQPQDHSLPKKGGLVGYDLLETSTKFLISSPRLAPPGVPWSVA